MTKGESGAERYGRLVRWQPAEAAVTAEMADSEGRMFLRVHVAAEMLAMNEVAYLRGAVTMALSNAASLAAEQVRKAVSQRNVQVDLLMLLAQITPPDFMRFRDVLRPASGYYSPGAACVELVASPAGTELLRRFDGTPDVRAQVETISRGPTLWDALVSVIGGASGDVVSRLARVLADRPPGVFDLVDAMSAYDVAYGNWKDAHLRIVHRLLGCKPGTAAEATRPEARSTSQFLRDRARPLFPILQEAVSLLEELPTSNEGARR